jgi:hypothetical protein
MTVPDAGSDQRIKVSEISFIRLSRRKVNRAIDYRKKIKENGRLELENRDSQSRNALSCASRTVSHGFHSELVESFECAQRPEGSSARLFPGKGHLPKMNAERSPECEVRSPIR